MVYGMFAILSPKLLSEHHVAKIEYHANDGYFDINLDEGSCLCTRRGTVEILAAISVVLGIIVSCITIYQAFVKRTPSDSSQSQPTFRQQYPQSYFQQYPPPQVYYPSQRQVRTFSWGGCVGTTIGITVGLFLLILSLFLLPIGRISTSGLIIVGIGILLLSLLIGIIVGFRRGRE